MEMLLTLSKNHSTQKMLVKNMNVCQNMWLISKNKDKTTQKNRAYTPRIPVNYSIVES